MEWDAATLVVVGVWAACAGFIAYLAAPGRKGRFPESGSAPPVVASSLLLRWLEGAALSHPGARPENQDRFLLAADAGEEHLLVAVADGLGDPAVRRLRVDPPWVEGAPLGEQPALLRLEPGDLLLLCSDGLTGPLQDDLLARLVAGEGARPGELVRRLVEAARRSPLSVRLRVFPPPRRAGRKTP